MPPSPSFSSPIPPPADGVPPVLMVTTLARQAESLARREQLSREVDRAVEEINLQLLEDRDKVTGRDVPPASSGKSPRTGSDLQASGGEKGGEDEDEVYAILKEMIVKMPPPIPPIKDPVYPPAPDINNNKQRRRRMTQRPPDATKHS